MRFTPGQHIGRYVIESLLGEGGMGEVYRARDSRLERSVALKVLRNEAEGSSEEWDHAVLRMQREAQAVAALSHPGIVAIYDIGEHEGVPFIAMELVGGQPLRDLIGKEPQRATNLRILLDVARALGAAHEAGFVHRDIKPENILVRQDGMAKILDFGIARKTSLNNDRTAQTLDVQGTTIDAALIGMTAEGAIVGTPAYMSPEQLRGETADARSDQFAWGVVAYELLSGTHPFHAEKGAIGLLSAILGETPVPLEGLPEGVAPIVMRALAKDPNERWGSMQEIVANWESFVTNGDSRKLPAVTPQDVAATPSQTANTPAPVRSSRARWVIAPIIALAALTAVVAFAFRERPAPVVKPLTVPSAAPAIVATTVTDLKIPDSTSAVAIAEYRQGLQYIRDAQWTAAARAFQHARQADPGMAAAHMRYSFIHYSYDITMAREAYRKAVGLRAALSERDQGFLHALEPVMLREPSDFREAAKRLEPLVERYPLDAELTFWLSRVLYYGDANPAASERVVELNTRCTDLDPQYADCWQTKAQGLVRLGKAEEAGKALNQCVQVSENAVDCLIDAIGYESILGRCDSVVEMAKRLKTKDPNALHVGIMLPEALYYAGAEEAVVRAAFEDAEKRAREAGRLFDAQKALFVMAVSYGELTKGLEMANMMARTMRAPTAEAEMALWLERAALYTEMDKPSDAGKLAEEFLIAKALHPQSGSMKFLDPSVFMHALRLRAGKLTASEYQRLRSEWLGKQTPKGIAEETLVWLYAYAFPAISPELAKDAVEHAPREVVALSPQKQPFPKIFDAHYGQALARTGHYAEAIPRLEEALRVCNTNDTTMWTTQYRALLGYAREATGNKAGACAEYRRVHSLWGKSKESLTIKEVNKRVKKLGCESTPGQGTP